MAKKFDTKNSSLTFYHSQNGFLLSFIFWRRYAFLIFIPFHAKV